MSRNISFNIDVSKSPSELSGIKILKAEWETSLMENARKYSEIPLSKIEDEGLRLLLGQNLFLDVIVPAALCFLDTNPLAGGHLENGALMRTLFLRVDRSFWDENPKLYEDAVAVFKRGLDKLTKKFSATVDVEEIPLLKDAEENFIQIRNHLALLFRQS
jgi:hypothetical protein